MGARFGGARMREWLPPALLLAAMSAALVFGGARDTFYRVNESHAFLSSQHLSVAANLSPRHNFLMHTERTRLHSGGVHYTPYSRFPIGGYALMKLAILPFDGSLSGQIYAARTLMLALFAATAALAYLAVRRLSGNRWTALSATLLAFSSAYLLYYNDMTSSEIPSLFGVMLTFHGMVVFAQEGRFRQLLVKACVAVCLGWHVYALLLPFIAVGMAGELVGALRASSALPALARARRVSGALVRSRHIALGAAALALGLAMLAFNFGNEYLALNGDRPFNELPSVQSMFARTGFDGEYDSQFPERLRWMSFLREEFIKIGFMSVPFALDSDSVFVNRLYEFPAYHYLAIGLAAAAGCAAALLMARHKALWATLAVAGFCWALPMRRTAAFHDFEGIFHVGVPLFLFTAVLLWIGKRYGARAVRDLSIASLAVFVLSAFEMGRSIHSVGVPRETELRASRINDFEAIREIAKGKNVFISQGVVNDWDSGYARHFYLHGDIIVDQPPSDDADFIISAARQNVEELLTPENSTAFLYDNKNRDFWTDAASALAENSEPVYRGEFDVYVDDGKIFYVGPPRTFKVASLTDHFTTEGLRLKAHLNVGSREENWRWERRNDWGDWTIVHRDDPPRDFLYMPSAADEGYQIRARANYIDNYGVEAEAITAPTGAVPALPASEPIASINGGVPRFFLHITPVDENDLPDAVKENGFENLDFDFENRVFDPGPDLRQIAMVELPRYPIAVIETGQFTDEGKIWSVKARLDGGE